MLDIPIKVIEKWPLNQSAKLLNQFGITANQTTLFGFLVGCLAFPALAFQQYEWALGFIVFNRVCDGLDGACLNPRHQRCGRLPRYQLPDFLFYSLIPLAL